MKTLCLGLMIIVSVVIVASSGLAYAQLIPAGGPLIELTTTKNNFVSGEIIPIRGHFMSNYMINIALVNQYGDIKNSTQVMSNNTGYFDTNLGIPSNAKGGTWWLFARSGENYLSVGIMVNANSTSLASGNFPSGLSPLKQFKFQIISNEIQCRSDLKLAIKAEDGSPACVKPEDVTKLIERGWAQQTSYNDTQLKPKVTLYDYSYDGIDKDNTTVSINNQTYYQTTLNYADYDLKKGTLIQFQNVTFAFPEGTMNTPGGSFIMLDMKFQDGSQEIYGENKINPDGSGAIGGIEIPTQYGPHLATNSTTVLSNHLNPQAGLTIYNDKIKLLVSTNNPKLTYMNIKVYSSYTPSSLADHFLTGSLYSTAGPIQNGNITITVNGLVMGTTETYPTGCFQFNNWNDSKLADQINKSRSLGISSTELNFQTQYFGDSNHNPANASASSYLSLYAVPLAPAQYDTMLYPSSQINVTQGDSTQFHLTVKPFSKYWEVEHMKLNLQRTPCGLSYHISPVDNNDSVLVNNTASFDVVLNTTSYTPSGKYWISIDQNMSGINEPNIAAEVGTFDLNVLKK